VTIMASLIGLLVLAPAAAAICLPPVLSALALYAALLRRLARREYAVLLAEEQIAGDAGAALVALRDVVACGAERRVATTVGSRIDAAAAAARSVARAGAAQRLVVALGGEAPLVVVLALAPWLMHHAGLTTGEVAGAATYLGANLLPAMRTLVETLGTWGLQLAIVCRRLAEAVVLPADSPRTGWMPQRARGYELRLCRASFAYGLRSDPIIQELDLLVPEGDHLAIVGPSGIGKSTVADLLSGAVEPSSGDVLLGGISLRRIDPGTITQDIALLPQEAYVFTGSLRENLTYLCEVCSDHDLDEAVETLGLRVLVNRLGGYDGQIDTLSNGERQLIALARVWLSPARVVVLDEATAHLDLATEAVVEEAFARRAGTLIVVAHRITSARRARRVLLMETGRVSCGSDVSHLGSSHLYEQMVRQWQRGLATAGAGRLPSLGEQWRRHHDERLHTGASSRARGQGSRELPRGHW